MREDEERNVPRLKPGSISEATAMLGGCGKYEMLDPELRSESGALWCATTSCYSTGCADGLGSRPSVAFLNSRPEGQNSASVDSLCSTYGTVPFLPLRPSNLTWPKQSLQRKSVSESDRATATFFTFLNSLGSASCRD